VGNLKNVMPTYAGVYFLQMSVFFFPPTGYHGKTILKSKSNAHLYAVGGPWVLIADGTKVLSASFVPDCPTA
jgi:hypothetical protein